MTADDLALYRALSKTKIYKERFGDVSPDDKYFYIPPGIAYIRPPVFDPERPERCLWGMVDWSKWRIKGGVDSEVMLWSRDDDTGSDRLDLALIRAILKQATPKFDAG